MFFLHNIEMFLCNFRIRTRTFGCRHAVAGHQARDLGQDLGAVQLVISVEHFSFGRGFVLSQILGDLVSQDLVIGS